MGSSAQALNSPAPAKVALVYAGPGACQEGCVTAAAQVARRAGIQTRLVRPRDIRPSIFRNASLWIQPGGDAIVAATNLSADHKRLIQSFISGGGGYLGFCAGAFLADSKVDDANTVDGLALIPGTTHDHKTTVNPVILPTFWGERTRYVYFEEGGWFDFPAAAPVSVLARYQNDAPAAIKVGYGHGRVVLTFPHPEAPEDWKTEARLDDPDGSDFSVAEELLHLSLPENSGS